MRTLMFLAFTLLATASFAQWTDMPEISAGESTLVQNNGSSQLTIKGLAAAKIFDGMADSLVVASQTATEGSKVYLTKTGANVSCRKVVGDLVNSYCEIKIVDSAAGIIK